MDTFVAVPPQCVPCLGLEGLHTPFTWYSPVLTVQACHEVDDKLYLLGTPWSVLINRLHTAYSYFSHGHFEAGRSRLVVCFMQLLPAQVDDCEIVSKHREALRHVLDATWAAMEQLQAMGQSDGLHKGNADWKDFTSTITPYKDLNKRQRAAVCAIRGILAEDPQFLRKAIKHNPTEGEWRVELGYILCAPRGPAKPTSEEISTLRKGHHLRPNVDSMTRLASTLSVTGRKGLEEAVALLEEVLVLYPTHPTGLFQCGFVLPKLQKKLGKTETVNSVELLERCLAAVDGKSAYVLFMLAVEYAGRGLADKSKECVDRALAIDRIAVDGYRNEIMMHVKPVM